MERGARRRRSRELRAQARHDNGLSPASRLRIAADVHRHSTSDDDSGCVLEEYAWWPSGIKPDMVHLYFACLPEDKVPFVGSVGEKWRARQLRHQLPPQDSDPRYCSELLGDEVEDLKLFDRRRKAECIGIGSVQQIPYDSRQRRCKGCSQPMEEGEIAVVAQKTDSFYHPACFHCHDCRTLLVDLIYFAHEGQVYCGRHHAEQIKPRCARCDELIFGEECTEAEGRTWHLHHFQCSECGEVLGGQRYMQKNNKPACLNCYHNSNPTVRCAACCHPIPADNPVISQGDLSWHAAARCFSCCVCGKNLLGISYSLRDGRLYCGKNGCQNGYQGELDARLSPESRLDARPPRNPTSLQSPRMAPRPPQRAPPPPPPAENIYETVLPCSSGSSPEFDKKYASNDSENTRNYYSRTPNRGRRMENTDYSSSSSDSDDDDLYLANMLAAASMNRARQVVSPPNNQKQLQVRLAKKKKSSRCIVS